MLHIAAQVAEAAGSIRSQWDHTPRAGIILGTGLGGLADEIEGGIRIPYAAIPYFPRSTAMAHQLSTHELRKGAKTLTRKVLRYKPRFIAIVGITSYRIAFDRKEAKLGLQPEKIGDTKIWVVPNPSGLNAHYQVSDLAKLFRALKNAASNDAET